MKSESLEHYCIVFIVLYVSICIAPLNSHGVVRQYPTAGSVIFCYVSSTDVKMFFRFPLKTHFYVFFYFLNAFSFQAAIFFILLNLLNSEIKRPLSDGLNTTASPMLWDIL